MHIVNTLVRYSIGFFFILFCLTACTPKPEAYDSTGKAIYLSHYKGKWVIINYWATWCKPCLKEMPVLNTLYEKNKNKLVVLGVSYDKLANQKINTIKMKYAISYSMLSKLSLKTFGLDKITILPLTLIINPQGKVVKVLKGPQTEEQFIKALGSNIHG